MVLRELRLHPRRRERCFSLFGDRSRSITLRTEAVIIVYYGHLFTISLFLEKSCRLQQQKSLKQFHSKQK